MCEQLQYTILYWTNLLRESKKKRKSVKLLCQIDHHLSTFVMFVLFFRCLSWLLHLAES